MTMDPLVSIIICVRNGMPHVREAVESVRAQSYGNYELVIQDGASTDGTREYLESLTGFPAISVVSEPDAGQGQGFNRAVKRCRGAIIGSVDADNRMQPGAIASAVRAFHAHPDAAVVYGACNMIDADGAFLHAFLPAKFDLLGLLDGSVVPPFGSSYFSPAICGDRLYFDEDFPVVPDFALWLRLAHLPILRVPDVFLDVRAGKQSSTYQPESYDQQTHFKLLAAKRFLSDPRREQAIAELVVRAEAGISLWAVDSMQVIGAAQERVDHYFAKAVQANIRTERFRAVVTRARPVLHQLDPDLEQEILGCGIEFQRKMQPESALVYFELLERSGSTLPGLPVLIEQSRRVAREIHLSHCMDVIDRLQGEINTRDRLMADMQERLIERQAAVDLRDQMLRDTEQHLQGEIQLRDRLLEAERNTFTARWRRRLDLGRRLKGQ